MAAPRIVLLHATPVAIDPVLAAFGRIWPEAETVNLLDDGLSRDRAREPDLGPAMIERFVAFGHYARLAGADGLLVTCSAFGPAIDRLARELPIPVLKPNEAMFRAALERGRRIAMLATFAPAIGTMEAEFAEFVAETGSNAELTTILVPGAMDALRAGDAETHNRLIAARAADVAGFDAVMLAHFSTSRAAEALGARTDVAVLSAPEAAVARMRARILGADGPAPHP
jgi:Asp/Glu/hydantoin racemase